MTRTTRQAAGALEVRVSGEMAGCDALVAILAAHPAVEVIRQSGPRRNNRDPGVRVYVTALVKTAVDASVTGYAQSTAADFGDAVLAWSSGSGPAPGWQAWANRLAGALGSLLGGLGEAPTGQVRQP